VDSRLRRCPPDRASAVPYGQAGENALRFPHLAHRSAAAHKPHSAATAARIVFDSGKGETLRPATGLSLFFPDPVQTAGTTAGLRVSQGIHRAEGGVGHLVLGTQEDQGHRADIAAGRHRPRRQRRIRRHVRHCLWIHRGRVHVPRAARLCRGYTLTAAAGARCLQGQPDRPAGRAHLYRVLAREAGRLRAQPRPARRCLARRTPSPRPASSPPTRKPSGCGSAARSRTKRTSSL